MAVVSPMPVNPQLNFISYKAVEIRENSARRSEIVEEQPALVVEEKIYVALGKGVSECDKSTLKWTLQNSMGKRICILHIHQPAQRIPLMGTKFFVHQLDKHQVRAHREKERQEMDKILRDYTVICERAGVRVDVLHIEMDSVEKGIVELIQQHNIRKLVMGTSADKGYFKKIVEVKSKKAIYVRSQALVTCEIFFICKGILIHTREGKLQNYPELGPVTNQETLITELVGEPLRSQSSKEGYSETQNLISWNNDYCRAKSNIDLIIKVPTPSPSAHSCFSSCSSDEFVDNTASTSAVRTEDGLELLAIDYSIDAYQNASAPPMPEIGDSHDGLYDQLKQAYAEAESSRREAFEESMRRSKAEKDAIVAFRKAKTSETLYAGELRQRKEIEEALKKSKEETERMKHQLDDMTEKILLTLEQNSSLENQKANSDQMVQELEQKMMSAVEMLQQYKRERDELQVERDNALKHALVPKCLSMFSYSEIEEATNYFEASLRIGVGGYGTIYKGRLRHTQVAIKMLSSESSQGPSEFQQEVNVLTKLRHPNVVTLIGSCPEAWILVYEFYPNGSLEDRLDCKNNSSPLSWQTRIRIAAELCSALIFLHSCCIVHGDLKPSNVLLDSHFVSKLGDFGISRVISKNDMSNNTSFQMTEPKGTLVYIDPEFLQTGELRAQSDVYSFGIILLQLLTGRPALGLIKDVQCALSEKGNLKDLLDPIAGDWPFLQAKQLAHLAMRCCEMNHRERPDLVSEVWKVLEPMRVSCGTSFFWKGSEEHCHIPPYFICPIFQEIMQDPHVAADGYTYELEALKAWLDGGHDTSPMTNVKLPHRNLVPNHALRSAVQEWLQQAN